MPNPYTLSVPVYPLSAKVLLDVVSAWVPAEDTPPYVIIDVHNFRNQLHAHLQHVAAEGSDAKETTEETTND